MASVTPTPKKIADIKLNLLRPALTSHFAVTIPKPPSGGFDEFLKYNGVILNQGKLNLMCSEATLPGSNLATFEINDNFHGVTERHAYRRVYDDRIDLTFYVDADNYLPIRYFETWMKYIVNESRGKQTDKNTGSEDREYFYRVRYPEGKDGYTADGLTVTKFERDYTQTLEYKFIRSFPISINSMPVSYDASSLLKCTVSMSYIRYVLIQGSNKAEPQSTTKSTGDPSSPNFTATPQQLAQINTQAFNSNIDLSSVTGNITPGGVPFGSAGASQIDFVTAANLNLNLS
jgi:hypothetical protein